MSKDAKPESQANDLKIVTRVRVVGPDEPGAKELHDEQVEVLARNIRRIALERRKRNASSSSKREPPPPSEGKVADT